MKSLLLIGLLTVCGNAFGQALINDRMATYRETPPPGLVYSDGRATIRDSYFFQIGFRIDPEKFDSSQIGNGCSGWTPTGYWLYDRHPDGPEGRWMITVGGNGRLCFKDMPRSGWGINEYPLQFDTVLGACHMLTAERLSDGTLTVTLDGISKTVTEQPGSGVRWRSGPNGIGVGREVNGYHSRGGNDSFPGEVYWLNDNGNVLSFTDPSQLTGRATLGTSVCDVSYPPPEPDPGPCDIDPDSVECACETNPHPACTACIAP